MSPRTKDSSKSDLRKNERMVREMTAWLDANVPKHLRDGRLDRDRTVLAMVKAAFIAGWKSKNLKEHEPAIRSGLSERDLADAMHSGSGA